jgi:SAM-dependent methyltransferase
MPFERRARPFERTARAYDLVHAARGKDYADEAAQIEALVRRLVPEARSLLDVACGTAHHLAYLAGAFEAVAGVDPSEDMRAEARRRHPSIDVHAGDMRTFRLPRRFDAVTCLFSSIGYMLTPEDLAAALATMAAHLATPGVLIVEGWITPDEWIAGGVIHADSGGDGELAVARVSRSWADGPLSRIEMDWLIGSRQGVEHVPERHTMRLFTPDEYRDAIVATGLEFEQAQGLTGRGLYIGVKRA